MAIEDYPQASLKLWLLLIFNIAFVHKKRNEYLQLCSHSINPQNEVVMIYIKKIEMSTRKSGKSRSCSSWNGIGIPIRYKLYH
jgi:hypothetical protein